MEYNIEKKLKLDGFKKITNNEIVKVHDNYIWSKARDGYECIMDIYGNTLYSLNVFDFEVAYLGRGYFKQIPKSFLNSLQIYKDGNSLAGIKDIRFDDSAIIGYDSNGSQCLLDDNGAIISKWYNSIHKFSNSITPVRLLTPKDKMKFGFINKLGNEVI